jgi:prophage antirepressor-like protein
VYGTAEYPYFKGKQIAQILGYENTRQAIRINVDEEDIKKMSEIGGLLNRPPKNR